MDNNGLNKLAQEMSLASGEGNLELDREMLYHYTSASALRKILRQEGIMLRFTKYGFVNDTSEGKVIMDMFHSACDRLLMEEKITREFYIDIANVEKSGEKNFYVQGDGRSSTIDTIIKDEFDAYICCFSTLPDSLPMWNYYIKNDEGAGYNIAMSSVLCDGLLRIGGLNRYNCGIYKINYADVNDPQSNIFYKWIAELAPYSGNIDAVRKILSTYLMRAQLMYKHSCFEHEQEVRFVLYLPKHLTKNRNFNIEYTEKKGVIIPYIDVLIPNKKLVHGIKAGALVPFQDARDGVATLLSERSYPIDETSITSSDMPVRF